MADPMPATTDPETFDLSFAAVARELAVNRTTVLRWNSAGVAVGGVRVRLEARRVGGKYRTSRAAVGQFLAACQAGREGVPVVRTPAQVAAAAAAARKTLAAMGVKVRP